MVIAWVGIEEEEGLWEGGRERVGECGGGREWR